MFQSLQLPVIPCKLFWRFWGFLTTSGSWTAPVTGRQTRLTQLPAHVTSYGQKEEVWPQRTTAVAIAPAKFVWIILGCTSIQICHLICLVALYSVTKQTISVSSGYLHVNYYLSVFNNFFSYFFFPRRFYMHLPLATVPSRFTKSKLWVGRHWKGLPSPHPWRCSRNDWMWHAGLWSGWQGLVGLSALV